MTITDIGVNETVRYIPEVILDPTTRMNWTVLDVDKHGVVTLAPAPGNDIGEPSRTVFHDQLEVVADAVKAGRNDSGRTITIYDTVGRAAAIMRDGKLLDGLAAAR